MSTKTQDTQTQTAPVLRMPRIEEWIDVPGYPGFQVKVWANAPQRVLGDLVSGDSERVSASLSALVLEHNGWVDDQGEPLPPADDPTFWQSEDLPRHLAVRVLQAIEEAISRPNSAAARRPR
jgi:hypothetical protein